MRIKEHAYNSLKELCDGVLAAHPNAKAEYQERGLSKTRFIWDVFHATKPLENWDCERESGGYWVYHDAHIETALNRIIKY